MRIEKQAAVFAGWDIGGTKSAVVIGTAAGEILARNSWPSQTDRGSEAMMDQFLSELKTMLDRFGPVAALGVSIGGPLDPINGIVYSPPHLPGWDNLPLRDRLMEKLGIPVTVEHDAAACLLAEHLWGCAAGLTHAAYLTAGTGCGAGFLIDGGILRGPFGQTPEVGHIRLSEHGPFLFGKSGSAEGLCSGTGIALLASALFPDCFPEPVPVPKLAELASSGDEPAKAVLLTAAQWMGRLCAIFGDIFSLQTIIIGSLASYLPDWWLAEIRAEFHREVLPRNGARTNIVKSALGRRLQDLSAIAPCAFRCK